MRKILLITFIHLIVLQSFAQTFNLPKSEVTKPWTYWWWPGSAVNKQGITAQLENFKRSGLGGAHIIPIYGVKGEEAHFLPYLGKQWLDIFSYTSAEAKRLGLGIDLSTGTGWPFGGPSINKESQAKQLVFNEINSLDTLTIRELMKKSTYADADIFLISNDAKYKSIQKSTLLSQFPVIKAQKYLIVTYEPTNQKVKRAAPGGEGLVVDHFDPLAMREYLHVFDTTLFGIRDNQNPRAMYNDSYEVYRANWTTNFFETFKKQHHYNLKEIIYMVSPGFPDTLMKGKVISDYRETLSSLLYDTERTWTSWIAGQHMVSRYQAHGSPGNLLDLYALADIPETESFGSSSFKIPNVRVDPDYKEKNFGRPNPLMMKFASSPAHLLGKRLVASESTTWLGNHFKVALSQIKPQIDELFTSGINHIFFHGTTYSPKEESFPGWLFYASTNYGIYSHFYNEFPFLNRYITNCQKLLQNSEPDNDVLVYLPIFDFWSDTREPLLSLFTVHHADKWFLNTPFGKLANRLWEKGYGFDYISDQQISRLKVNPDHSVSAGKCKYRAIVIPKTIHMTTETVQALIQLSKRGVLVIFDQSLPLSLPGKGRDQQQPLFSALKTELGQNPEIVIGKADSVLNQLNIRHETFVNSGLSFIRKRNKSGNYWFIANLSDTFYNDSIHLSGNAAALEFYDPINNDRGFIEYKNEGQRIGTKLYLPPGSSCFLISYNQPKKGKIWKFRYPSEESVVISDWEVKFQKGTPLLPSAIFHLAELTSWTTWKDSTLQWYNGYGTYSVSFDIPAQWHDIQGVYLKIDDLRETARVTLNGTDAGTIWSVPYELFIPSTLLKSGRRNKLELEVRNLSANEVRYLDTHHIYWKKFYDANIVDITYRPFEASLWLPVPSGILGKVKVIAVK